MASRFNVYEFSNHLSNVLVTLQDKVFFEVTEGRYYAVVSTATDYYPFGSAMPGRSYAPDAYRYGFNGVERCDEISSGHNTTFFREQDTRLGRWWSFDPKPSAGVSPYAMMENNPICFADVLGDTIGGNPPYVWEWDNKSHSYMMAIQLDEVVIMPSSVEICGMKQLRDDGGFNFDLLGRTNKLIGNSPIFTKPTPPEIKKDPPYFETVTNTIEMIANPTVGTIGNYSDLLSNVMDGTGPRGYGGWLGVTKKGKLNLYSSILNGKWFARTK